MSRRRPGESFASLVFGYDKEALRRSLAKTLRVKGDKIRKLGLESPEVLSTSKVGRGIGRTCHIIPPAEGE